MNGSECREFAVIAKCREAKWDFSMRSLQAIPIELWSPKVQRQSCTNSFYWTIFYQYKTVYMQNVGLDWYPLFILYLTLKTMWPEVVGLSLTWNTSINYQKNSQDTRSWGLHQANEIYYLQHTNFVKNWRVLVGIVLVYQGKLSFWFKVDKTDISQNR